MGAADDIVAKLLPDSWLSDVKRECITCREQNFWHKLWTLRLMTGRAMFDSDSLLHTVYYSSASQEDHIFSLISADHSTAEKHPSKIPRQGVESHPVRA